MALTPEDIGRIANLARLHLSPEDSGHMLTKINGFFDLVAQMQAVDTRGIEPLAHPYATVAEVALRLREDWPASPTSVKPTSAARLWSSRACSWCPK